MKIFTTCPFCGEDHLVEVLEKDYHRWQDGEKVQNAFPYLSADNREMLISGICPTCWESTFGDEEDSEEDEDYNLDEGFDPYEGCYTFDC